MPEVSINNMLMAHAAQFLDRVQHELCKYALGVRAESPGTDARRALADRVLADPGNFASKLAVGMVSDASLTGTYAPGPPVDSSATDASIYAVINALWDKWVNVV